MRLIHGLYQFSLSTKLSSRLIFWSTITILNAIIGWMFSMDEEFSSIGKILGISTWICIYVGIIAPAYIRRANSILGISLFWAYIIKTLSVAAYPLSATLDLMTGILIVGTIDNIVSVEALHAIPLMHILYTYTITVLHGGVLSILTLILGYIIYAIRRLLSKKTVS